MEELIIKNAKIIFAELEDKGFGRNIVIDVTDKELQDLIVDYYKAEKIGKGKPTFKDYTNKDGKTTTQFTIKLSDYCDIEGKDGLGAKDLRYGSEVNVLIKTYAWKNSFGEGISARAQDIYVLKAGAKANMAKIAE